MTLTPEDALKAIAAANSVENATVKFFEHFGRFSGPDEFREGACSTIRTTVQLRLLHAPQPLATWFVFGLVNDIHDTWALTLRSPDSLVGQLADILNGTGVRIARDSPVMTGAYPHEPNVYGLLAAPNELTLGTRPLWRRS